jgi:hypothetical protein
MGARMGQGSARAMRIARIIIGVFLMFAFALSVRRYKAMAEVRFPYSVAFVDYRAQLEVFPTAAKEFSISLPIALSRITYAPDGRSLYGFSPPRKQSTSAGLLRVQLNPIQVTSIPETAEFGMVNDVAVSARQDRFVFSARRMAESSPACGIFELDLRSGMVRKIVGNSTCEYPLSWVRLSLSPDTKRLVAFRKPRLELIDMEQGAIRSLGEEYIAGAWSPDGKWLAVLERGGNNRTVLLDALSLTRKRVFGTSNVQWSPDSRFLLGVRSEQCTPELASLVVIDVQNGKETILEGSHCKIDLNTTGWVNSDVGR